MANTCAKQSGDVIVRDLRLPSPVRPDAFGEKALHPSYPLFMAKAMGRSQLCVFSPELLQTAATQFSTGQGLRRAIERGEFELLFQPELSTETLETVAVEALIRWRMPDGTLATPDNFLAVAEESGMITEINDWVLEAAIKAAAQ